MKTIKHFASLALLIAGMGTCLVIIHLFANVVGG